MARWGAREVVGQRKEEGGLDARGQVQGRGGGEEVGGMEEGRGTTCAQSQKYIAMCSFLS